MKIVLRFFSQPGLHRIVVDVASVSLEIVLVSYLALGETRMPDWEAHPWPFPDFPRRSALNELHRFFERSGLTWSQDDMLVVRHHDMAMDKVHTLIAITKNSFFHNPRSDRVPEQRPPLPSVGCHEVRCSRLRTMFWSSQLVSGAKAPLLSSRTAGLKPRPSISLLG